MEKSPINLTDLETALFAHLDNFAASGDADDLRFLHDLALVAKFVAKEAKLARDLRLLGSIDAAQSSEKCASAALREIARTMREAVEAVD